MNWKRLLTITVFTVLLLWNLAITLIGYQMFRTQQAQADELYTVELVLAQQRQQIKHLDEWAFFAQKILEYIIAPEGENNVPK